MRDEAIVKIRALGFPWDCMDPFIFCVHHNDIFPKATEAMEPDVSLEGRMPGQDFTVKDGFRMYHGKTVPGFPAHPHSGFETITVVRKGLVDHADSTGAAGRYGNGDVQWMTAGRGVQHSEMFPLLDMDHPNPVELFQIWLNLPGKAKTAEPYFKMLWSDQIPVFLQKDENGKETAVQIITGKIGDTQSLPAAPESWAANPANEVNIWVINMEAGAKWEIPASSVAINRMLYFYKGEDLAIVGKKIPFYHATELRSDIPASLEAGASDISLLLLQGRPIGEPMLQYGPFVMNSRDQIVQALSDFERTAFGGWPWPRLDQVHDRKRGRFALYADGSLEQKDLSK